ncbi:phage tail sheath C-terminal domain-containing protein [Fusobacterium perfoetens]|uniref:phage tail sheath C-terminal domain-containing protein n=1 Tax=Fusobacterium perfoetens TaxID=852 RepID=UPI001F43E8EE|nr:phage tail sheath C-terminal domain-containing protein [Fusobacterium perfoetens]
MNELAKLNETRAKLRSMLKAAEVGQINPYPVIKVYFETLARTAVQRSERGILVLFLTDTTKIDKWTTIKSVADLSTEYWTEENIALVQTAFEVFSPYKVMIRRKGSDDVAVFLKELETLKVTHLACPELENEDDGKVVTWIKGKTNTRNVVYVSAFATASDDCRVVELANKEVKHKTIKSYDSKKFTVMVAGAIAGCPLNRSLDNIVFPTITLVDNVEPANGKFAMYNDDDVVKCRLAINSKTTFDSTWKPGTRFIKIFEGMNIVKFDIEDTFKDYWCGLYINNYDNKIAFCNNINKVYFKELAPNVLSPDFDNKIDIDVEANKRYIVTDGKDPDTMSETEIRTYPTGEEVFLYGQVRFSNTMVNLQLGIQY